jgi:hypothetical protein
MQPNSLSLDRSFRFSVGSGAAAGCRSCGAQPPWPSAVGSTSGRTGEWVPTIARVHFHSGRAGRGRRFPLQICDDRVYEPYVARRRPFPGSRRIVSARPASHSAPLDPTIGKHDLPANRRDRIYEPYGSSRASSCASRSLLACAASSRRVVQQVASGSPRTPARQGWPHAVPRTPLQRSYVVSRRRITGGLRCDSGGTFP